MVLQYPATVAIHCSGTVKPGEQYSDPSTVALGLTSEQCLAVNSARVLLDPTWTQPV